MEIQLDIDLINRDYLIPIDDIVIFDFLIKNGFRQLKSKSGVVSIISNSTYGVVYMADDKLVFCKHKAIEINKGKKLPKICTDIQKTCKFITQEEVDKYFRKTNMVEILYFEMREEKELFNK